MTMRQLSLSVPWRGRLAFNDSDAGVAFVQSTRMQRFLKTIETLAYGYSSESTQ